jgi:hypothetical protein
MKFQCRVLRDLELGGSKHRSATQLLSAEDGSRETAQLKASIVQEAMMVI